MLFRVFQTIPIGILLAAVVITTGCKPEPPKQVMSEELRMELEAYDKLMANEENIRSQVIDATNSSSQSSPAQGVASEEPPSLVSSENATGRQKPKSDKSSVELTEYKQPKKLDPALSKPAYPPAKRLKPTIAELTPVSPPQDVCRVFIDALQSGDRYTAQQLLTSKAIIETNRANLELQAPGDENSQFEIQAPQYATENREIANVDCLIKQQGFTEQQVKLTWMMRRQPSGWKISGLTVNVDNSEVDLLSFENPTDVQRIKNSLTDEHDRQADRLPKAPQNYR